MTSPSWYDFLGVDPAASDEEIRAAWKAGITDLDPTDRRFRILNQAAEVLLDPDSRAEYDASLAEEAAVVEEVAQRPSRDRATDAGTDTEAVPEETSPGLETGAGAPSSTTDAPRRPIPTWLLIVLAVVTAALVGLAAWLISQPSDDQVADATSEAQAAAEGAVVTILAYDYRTLEDDQAAAGALMTDSYRAEYDKLFASVGQNAVDTKAVVTVNDPLASGVVRSGDQRVQVLLFVDRPTSNAERDVVFQDQVTMTMEKVGDTWLVDGLETTPLEP